MRFPRLLAGTVALLVAAGTVWAQLPAPPSESELIALVQNIRMMAGGQTNAATRTRIESYLDAAAGPPERMNNYGGALLIVRGYPWEGIWCLCRAALPDCAQPDVLSNMGFALAWVQRHDWAERVLLYTVYRWPEFAPAWTNLARVYLDVGDYEHAQAALEGGDRAEPGTAVNEECRARMAVMRGDTAAAADALVSLSNLDPGNPRLERLLEFVPEEELVNELQARVAAIPMPGQLVDLPTIIDNYEEFVLDELARGFWGAAARASAAVSTATDYQTTVLTQDVWDQLPPNIRAALAARGVGPGQSIEVLAPAQSRTHYPRLSIRLKHYQDRYLAQMPPLFRSGAVREILDAERERQRQFHTRYKEALAAGADPRAAMERWIRDSLASLNSSHHRWLAAMAEARAQANRYTRRYWMTVAGAISTLPEPWRSQEAEYLLKVATISTLDYTGEVLKWYGLGYTQVVLDREMTSWAADALHTAAADRAWQAYCDRMERVRDWEWELEDGANLGPPVEDWWGLNLAVFVIKFQADRVNITGGEGLVGDASFNWENADFAVGIGLGVTTPSPLPRTGAEGKVLVVIRIASDVGVGLGFREQVQVSAGTPVRGHDVNVFEHYNWPVTSGPTRF